MIKILAINYHSLHAWLIWGLQTLVVGFEFIEFVFGGIFFTGLMFYLLFTSYFFIPLLYLCWMYYDKDTIYHGGRCWLAFQRIFLWRYFAEYFPLKLHKTADLDPNKNYIIGCHPHGIVSISSYGHFSLVSTGFNEKFPGVTSHLATLAINFWMPIHREKLMFLGFCSAKKESIEYILSKSDKGNAVVIVIGGAAESLDAVPNTMELTLNSRKGFVKMALKHGASLVPCISFGENDSFSQKHYDDKHWIKAIQNKLKRVTGVSFPIFYGRGILGCKYGILPYRKPINTIVGKPIDVEKVEKPTDEDIDKLHQVYVKALIDLFYAYREKYAENPKIDIVIK